MAQYTNALTKVFFLPFLIPDPQFHTINCPHPAYSILFYSTENIKISNYRPKNTELFYATRAGGAGIGKNG